MANSPGAWQSLRSVRSAAPKSVVAKKGAESLSGEGVTTVREETQALSEAAKRVRTAQENRMGSSELDTSPCDNGCRRIHSATDLFVPPGSDAQTPPPHYLIHVALGNFTGSNRSGCNWTLVFQSRYSSLFPAWPLVKKRTSGE